MSLFDFSTTDTDTKSGGSLFNFSSTPSKPSAPTKVTPTVTQAVDSIKTPSLLDKVEGGLKSFWSDFTKPAINPAVKGKGGGVNPKALQATLIDSPLTDESANKTVNDFNARADKLLQQSKSVDKTSKQSVDDYNLSLDAFKQDSEKAQADLTQYNMTQKAHQVLSTPTGEGVLGPTSEQQFEKVVNGALLAGGLISGVGEVGAALESSARLIPLLTKGLTQGAIGIGTFTALDKATEGLKENANDQGKLAIYLGELFASGGILHGISEATPKIGDALFQTLSEKYNAPKTIYFDGSKVQQLIAHGDMTDAETNALIKVIGGDNSKIKTAFKNGITIEIPGSKIKTIAEKPFWSKIKSAFGAEPVAGTSEESFGKAKETVRGYLPSPSKEDLSAIAKNITEGTPIETTGPKITLPKTDVQGLATQFAPKLPEIKGLDKNQTIKLTPEQATPLAHDATEQYYTSVIKPSIDSGKATVIGADDMKDYFGKDYNENNHQVYSQAAFQVYQRALKENASSEVILTGGGPASGKTELVTKDLLSRGFKGIIYDSNLANYEGAVKQIDMAHEAGKTVQIYGVLPDIDRARTYSMQRENEIGRGVSDESFAHGHAGFPEVVQKLLENGKIDAKDVHIIDTRDVDTFEKALEKIDNRDYLKDPLATLKELGYSKDTLKKIYGKENYNITTGQRINPLPSSSGTGETFGENRADQRNANRQADEGVLEEDAGKEEKVSRKTLQERAAQLERVNEYKERLKLRGADPVLVDAIITPRGTRAYGASVGGTITLEHFVEDFTEDHEMFHQVFQNMEKMRVFKNFDKAELISEAKDLYGDLSPAQLEEEMAKDFQQYVNEQENGKSTSFFGKIAEFFQRLFASIKRLFQNNNDIKEFYRTVYSDRATQETEINNEMPKAFEQQVKDGVVDFRIQNATANFLDEVPVKDAFTDSGDLTLKTIQKLQGRSLVSKQYIYDLTNSGDIKQVERDLIRSVLDSLPNDQKVDVAQFAQDVKDELLPLTITNGVSPRYEGISLPGNVRGNVADYKENIYESLVRTTAGNVHFSGKGAENYFGHTRTEDMSSEKTKIHNFTKSSGTIRRVIEVQSDLYQKGGVDSRTSGPSSKFPKLYGEVFEEAMLEGKNRDESKQIADNYHSHRDIEILKLKQYNDPTAHFRMVREEIRKAAQDGKTKLQFPTGETAMKVEGLGSLDHTQFMTVDEEGDATTLDWTRDLKVGRHINGHGNDWIITDVLGDGKFKAVPKNMSFNKMVAGGDYGTVEMLGEGVYGDPRNVETFDISGKVDISNPIYRFYEKDLGRYIKNNYNAVPVTDDKGVTWMEVPIQKAYGDLPVPAFNERKETQTVEQLQNQRERFKQSLEAYKENPQAHIQAYGEDRSQFYKDRIDEITKRIQEIKNPKFDTGNKFDDLRAVLQHTEDRTGVESISPRTQQIKDKLEAVTPDADIPKIHVAGRDIVIPENLSRRQLSLELEREQLRNSPYNRLLQYVSKEGMFKGRLPEILGKKDLSNTSYSKVRNPKVIEFIRNGDKIIQEVFGRNMDAEEVRSNMEDYLKQGAEAKIESAKLRKDLSSYIKEQKDEIALDRISNKQLTAQEAIDRKKQEAESLANYKSLFETYAHEIGLPQSLDEVEPPKVKGGLVSPLLDIPKWKDKGVFGLARDTFERNIEKVAPRADANAIKKFLVEPIRNNELARVEFNNKLKLDTREKIKELGIKRNSKNDELVQKWGEGLLSPEELKELAPDNYQEIQKAAEYFRNQYDMLINKWNEVRREYGFPEVAKRKNYFRHFEDINFFTKTYGFLNRQDELPTEIAGKTEFFKPGKTFTSAEMKRVGKNTTYSAIGGFNNYIDSVSKQMFHIDSIQRGKALQNYIQKVAETGRRLGQPINLQGFVTNLDEYIKNGLAGKVSALDRPLENHFLGRKLLFAFDRISKLIGKNIIVGNISTALSHLVSIPLIAATTDKVPLIRGLMTTLTSPLKAESFTSIDGQKSSYLTRRFPVDEISPTMPKKAEEALSYLFITTDKFKSRWAVSGKYYEGISKGLSPAEAINQADIYAAKTLGDYSIGQKPNIMNTKLLGLIAQFQLGLNDSMSVLFHDISESESIEKEDEYGNAYKVTKKWSVTSRLIQFAIFSYLFNLVLKNIRGSGKGLDPIDLGLTLTGLNDEGQGQSFKSRAGLAVTDVLGEIPFTSIGTGNFPLATALTQPIKDLAAGDYTKMAEGIAANFASPIGGGAQIKKTVEGAQSINKGESVGLGQNMKSLIFGSSSAVNPNSSVSKKLNSSQKSAETKLSNLDSSLVDEVRPIYDQAKAAGFGTPEADEIVSPLSGDLQKQEVYKAMKAVDQAKDAVALESKILPIVQQASLLGFGTKAANDYINEKFQDTTEGHKEYDVYKTIKTTLFGADAGIDTNPDSTTDTSSTWNKQSFIAHIGNMAKALGTDPVTTFNDIFAGNQSYRILGVENGQVMVARADQAVTDAIRKKQGATKEMRLDHTVSIEAGGNNGNDNLLLIPKGDKYTPGTWAWNTPTENMIGKALKIGKITGAKAREYDIRFKMTAKENLSNSLKKEFKDKYNSQPITPEQIQQELGFDN